MNNGKLHRFTAFSNDPAGGNPAGVWVGDFLPDTKTMQRIAAEVNFSETAFVAPAKGLVRSVRYYSPLAEVPFCGHATIATGAVLGTADVETTYRLQTKVGEIPVVVSRKNGGIQVSLTSVDTQFRLPAPGLLSEILEIINWSAGELDETLPPAIAFAGAWHFVIAASSPERLANLDYDFGALKQVMLREDLTTLQLVFRESPSVFHARNPFPTGGVVEDPATGAAAAALGGYLRDAELIAAPAEITILQGATMGRPGRLDVSVPKSGGIVVSGSAVSLD